MTHRTRLSLVSLALLAASTSPTLAADFPKFEAQELDPHAGNVVYAVTTADVDADGKPDVVALTEDAVVMYRNPSWEKRVLLQGQTERDNVCIQPQDIDGDGRIDFALGAAWRPTDTQAGGTIQWLHQGADGTFTLHLIASEPTVHRMRWGDVLGKGRPQLVVCPLQGRGTKGPDWGAGNGVRVLVYTVPDDPTKEAWPVEVADDSLHTIHNLQLLDFDGDGRDEILCAAWEGVFLLDRDASTGRWSRRAIGSGKRDGMPKGSSEVKFGKLGEDRSYVATIEPWHGFQAVVYTPQEDAGGLWLRRVIDEPIKGGHAVWTANLDDDADDELIVGRREPNDAPDAATKGPGVWVYDPKPGTSPVEFTRHAIDDGGMASEDLVAADLDADGLPEIIAGGRSTHNVKIYWNRKAR